MVVVCSFECLLVFVLCLCCILCVTAAASEATEARTMTNGSHSLYYGMNLYKKTENSFIGHSTPANAQQFLC